MCRYFHTGYYVSHFLSLECDSLQVIIRTLAVSKNLLMSWSLKVIVFHPELHSKSLSRVYLRAAEFSTVMTPLLFLSGLLNTFLTQLGLTMLDFCIS